MENLQGRINSVLYDVYKAEATARAAAEQIEKLHTPVSMDDIQQIDMLTAATVELLKKIDSALQAVQVQAGGGE